MAAINWGRVISGGLAAGLVMNIGQTLLNAVVLAEQSAELSKRLNVPPPGGAQIGVFVLGTFAVGIVLAWLYAAMRPRYGAGPATALAAGLAVWFLSRFLPSLYYAVGGIIPMGLAMTAAGWSIVEVPLAALVAGWLYKED